MTKHDPVVLFSAAAANAGLDLLSPVKRVLDSHWYVLGKEVSGFENEFATYIGVDHCVSVANGTDALEIALRSVGVKNGDKVVAVANAGFYASTAIHLLGAIPVYVDVDVATLTMAPASLAKALELKPKAVIVTHLYGQLANIDELVCLARNAGVPLLEDCAQSHGARRNGQNAGSWGDVACFSFYPTKNLGALGDGGAIVTNDSTIAARLRALRQYGWSAKYKVSSQGGRNSRMDEMQAAILREKLPYLDGWNIERRRIASLYNEAFADLQIIAMPSIGEDYVAHLYVIRVPEREPFQDFLKSKGIATDVHYPIPDHLQATYPHALVVGGLPVTESASKSVVSLPCFPGLSASDVNRVISAVKEYFTCSEKI